jgi:hypothetical protein
MSNRFFQTFEFLSWITREPDTARSAIPSSAAPVEE